MKLTRTIVAHTGCLAKNSSPWLALVVRWIHFVDLPFDHSLHWHQSLGDDVEGSEMDCAAESASDEHRHDDLSRQP